MDKDSLKLWLKEHHGSQKFFAERLGISRQHLSNYLHGTTPIPDEWLSTAPEFIADYRVAHLLMRGDIARAQAQQRRDDKCDK